MSEPKKARKPQPRKALTRTDPLQDILLTPKRQCSAISKRTGKRCKNLAMRAQRTCRMHGGATRVARVAAAKRIADASGYAADMLVEFMADPSIDVKQRTVIAMDLLSRAGISGKQQVEVEVRNWEDVLDTVLVDIPDEPSDSNIEDAVVVTDERAAIEAAREADTAQRDAEMEERESQRRRRALRGKSPALKPTEQAALDQKLDRMNVVDKDKHAAFLLGRMAEGQPNRSHRRTFDKRP